MASLLFVTNLTCYTSYMKLYLCIFCTLQCDERKEGGGGIICEVESESTYLSNVWTELT